MAAIPVASDLLQFFGAAMSVVNVAEAGMTRASKRTANQLLRYSCYG